MFEQINNFFTIEMIYLWLNLGVLPFWIYLKKKSKMSMINLKSIIIQKGSTPKFNQR